MHAVDIKAHADKLYAALGPKALAEAAHKARQFEDQGNRDEADTWRRIERSLIATHGPRAK